MRAQQNGKEETTLTLPNTSIQMQCQFGSSAVFIPPTAIFHAPSSDSHQCSLPVLLADCAVCALVGTSAVPHASSSMYACLSVRARMYLCTSSILHPPDLRYLSHSRTVTLITLRVCVCAVHV